MRVKRSNTIVKYLFAGGSAFTVEYITFYSMYVLFGWGLLIANSLSFVVGLLTSFFINKIWTFGNDGHRKRAGHQLMLYAMLALVNLFIINILLQALSSAGADPRLGKLIVMLLIPAWNYYIFKNFIFATHNTRS